MGMSPEDGRSMPLVLQTSGGTTGLRRALYPMQDKYLGTFITDNVYTLQSQMTTYPGDVWQLADRPDSAVGEIVDIVDDTLNIEVRGNRPGVLGSAVIKGQATEIIDIDLPDVSGLDATRAIKAHNPAARVLIVSTNADPDVAVPARPTRLEAVLRARRQLADEPRCPHVERGHRTVRPARRRP